MKMSIGFFLQQTQSLPPKSSSFQVVTYPGNEEGRALMAPPSDNLSFQI